MSESQIKPIKINPELFLVAPRSKNKTFKKTTSDIKPNKLKQNLLAKIKNYRQNQQLSVNKNPEENSAEKMITKTENNINQIKVNKEKELKTSATVSMDRKSNNDDDFTQSINFLKDLSFKNKQKNLSDTFPLIRSNEEKLTYNTAHTPNHKPLYSSMKNSSLPTYREWKNITLKRQVNSPSEVSINTNGNVLVYPVQSDTFDRSAEDIKNGELQIEKKSSDLAKLKPPSRSTTLKYHLGKRGRIVGILVKNTATRKKISNEHSRLKQTKMSDMKSYLKRHNLLKSGSHAPPDVIKKLYEQALLGGDIRNSNKDSIIQNYLAE